MRHFCHVDRLRSTTLLKEVKTMFELDLRSGQPLYEQLMDKVKELIIAEVLKPDEQLPSVRILAQQLTINPNTIQKAYRELEREGYIYSLAGRGNFVAPMEASRHQDKLIRIREEITKLMTEALYLGMSRDALLEIVHRLEQESDSESTELSDRTGGNQHD
jgi:GntR family transcriptional regulator